MQKTHYKCFTDNYLNELKTSTRKSLFSFALSDFSFEKVIDIFVNTPSNMENKYGEILSSKIFLEKGKFFPTKQK